MPTNLHPSRRAATPVVPEPVKGPRTVPPGGQIFTSSCITSTLLRDVYTVLPELARGVEAGQVDGVPVGVALALGSPEDVRAGLLEAALLRTRDRLVPGRDVAPGPAGGLQRIGRGRQLPPVVEDQRGTGLDGRTVGLGEQGREPDAVGPLISVLAGEVGEVVLGVGGGVLRAGTAAGAVAVGSAAAVAGRIGDEGVDAVVGDGGARSARHLGAGCTALRGSSFPRGLRACE